MYYTLLFYFAFALVVSLILQPLIISLSKKWQMLAQPNDRSEHKFPTPSLGGVGIFISLLLGGALFLIFDQHHDWLFFMPSLALLFIVGIKDDLSDLSAGRKFLVQFIAAGIIIYHGVRIESLFGLLGIYELDYWVSVAFTFVAIVGITNAFNLIDGIDGLAGSLALINLLVLTFIFYLVGSYQYMILSAIVSGGILGFLRYNFHPAKIFMGDNGSLIIGFIMAVFIILILQNPQLVTIHAHAPMLLLAITSIPVFDTLRVFATRMIKGNSPFKADKSHIHHLLTNAGLNHRHASLLILIANLLVITQTGLMLNISIEFILIMVVISLIVITRIFSLLRVFKWLNEIKTIEEESTQFESKNPFFTNSLELK